MQIEHLTVLGNAVIRDSRDINLKTLDTLRSFQISSGVTELPLPHSGLSVKVTVTSDGALFDVKKGDNIAFLNACCFKKEHRETIMSLVKPISSQLYKCIIQEPALDTFLYTVPVLPFYLTPDEAMLAGEVELYIYYSLYLALK